MDKGSEQGAGTIALGAILIILGVLFLLGRITDVDVFSVGWPLFVIAPGVVLIVIAFSRGGGASHLAVPGSIVTMVGLILLVQNAFDYYESWAYAWTLIFPTALGVGLALHGAIGHHPKRLRLGSWMALIGLALFVVFAFFFELIINIGGHGGGTVAGVLGAVLLIILGALVILLGGRRPRRDNRSA